MSVEVYDNNLNCYFYGELSVRRDSIEIEVEVDDAPPEIVGSEYYQLNQAGSHYRTRIALWTVEWLRLLESQLAIVRKNKKQNFRFVFLGWEQLDELLDELLEIKSIHLVTDEEIDFCLSAEKHNEIRSVFSSAEREFPLFYINTRDVDNAGVESLILKVVKWLRTENNDLKRELANQD